MSKYCLCASHLKPPVLPGPPGPPGPPVPRSPPPVPRSPRSPGRPGSPGSPSPFPLSGMKGGKQGCSLHMHGLRLPGLGINEEFTFLCNFALIFKALSCFYFAFFCVVLISFAFSRLSMKMGLV